VFYSPMPPLPALLHEAHVWTKVLRKKLKDNNFFPIFQIFLTTDANAILIYQQR